MIKVYEAFGYDDVAKTSERLYYGLSLEMLLEMAVPPSGLGGALP